MPRQPDPHKRAAFLQAALQLFAEHGVQNTTTAMVARAAGTAAGTLFLYFPTKQDLVDALLLELGRQQSAWIQSQLDPTLPPRELFHTIWAGSINWLLERPAAFRYIQQARDRSLVSPAVVSESAGYFAYYYHAILKAQQEACIKPLSPDLIGAFLYHGIVAVTSMLLDAEDLAQREPVIRAGFEIFWDGIRA